MNKDIYKIFEEHWEYYSKKTATDIAQITGLTKHISNEYEGRVVYELMQNAFDPASKFVKVEIKDIDDKSYLIVSNDGTPFGYEKFNHATESIPKKKDNFHSLCSIATSNKTIEENIGNKGVGFKSVFDLSNEVYIVSKQDDEKIITFKLYGNIQKNEFLKIQKELTKPINLDEQEKLFNDKSMLIPGFYYPLLQEENYLEDTLDNDVITAIVIPLKDKKEQAEDLIIKIQNYHFEFIKERFKRDEDKEEKNNLAVYINNREFKKEKIEIFSELDFAILWEKRKNDNYSVLYNFMPSLFKSPFKCMDIHAEFQTSINREHIDLDEQNDIGKKNLLLLKKAIKFNFEKLEEVTINQENKDIFWKLLQINNEVLKPIIKAVLLEKYKKWNNFSIYIAKLAKKYFEQDNLTRENFDDFWKVINTYTEIISTYKKYTVTFKTDLNKYFLSYLVKEKACVIPVGLDNSDKDITVPVNKYKSLSEKIFFKDDSEVIQLSEKLNIFLTNYKFSELEYDTLLHKDTKCTIKKSTNNNELLKHFRQIPKDGAKTDDNKKYSEKEQIKILDSLYSIYKDKDYITTHRYSNFWTEENRKKFNVLNNAHFAISTIFLKTIDKDNPYKPAQLCIKKDLDIKNDFYSELKKKDNFDNFLKFLGVSFDDKYIFCEGKIYDNYKNGVKDIPAIIDENNGKLEAKDIIPNISIINLENSEKNFAWECYKNNHYEPILKELKNNTKDKSLDKIVKSIKHYPKGYLDKLLESLKDNSNLKTTKKLYQVIFNRQLEVGYRNQNYLIYSNGNVKLSSELKDVFIPKTKKDLNTIWEHRDGISKKFLMAFTDKFNSEDLKLVVVEENI